MFTVGHCQIHLCVGTCVCVFMHVGIVGRCGFVDVLVVYVCLLTCFACVCMLAYACVHVCVFAHVSKLTPKLERPVQGCDNREAPRHDVCMNFAFEARNDMKTHTES